MHKRFRAVAVLVLVACAGGDADELQGDDELEQHELEQVVDCRPVRLENCANAWNDRACFRVPPECAISRAAPGTVDESAAD